MGDQHHQRGGSDQYFSGISVAPDGRIDVAWYDFRNDPFFTPGESGGMGTAAGERFWDVYYATSDDDDATWSANTRVTNPSIYGTVGITFSNNDIRGPMGIRITAPAELGAAGGGPDVAWAGLGAAGALVVGGLALILASRRKQSTTAKS